MENFNNYEDIQYENPTLAYDYETNLVIGPLDGHSTGYAYVKDINPTMLNRPMRDGAWLKNILQISNQMIIKTVSC